MYIYSAEDDVSEDEEEDEDAEEGSRVSYSVEGGGALFMSSTYKASDGRKDTYEDT